MKWRAGIWGCVALATMACGGAPGVRTGPDGRVAVVWETEVYADHPLVGRIWSTARGAFVEPAALLEGLRAAPVVLLGERHDHADHHRLQGWILSRLDGATVVGFEMLDEADVAPIAGVTGSDALRDAVQWSQSGWPAFPLYRPVFDAVFAAGQQMVAVHPAKTRLRALMTGPASQSTENRALATTLSPPGLATLREDITQSHCGHASPVIVDAMVLAQRFKDRWMMARLLEAAGTRPAVLVAGNGHVRKDYGAPNDLAVPAASVGLIEVEGDKLTAADYHPERFDWVWFTPRVDDVDPCEKFRTQLERIRAHSKAKREGG